MKAYVCAKCEENDDGLCLKFSKACAAVKACSFAGTRNGFNKNYSAGGARHSRRFHERDMKERMK